MSGIEIKRCKYCEAEIYFVNKGGRWEIHNVSDHKLHRCGTFSLEEQES